MKTKSELKCTIRNENTKSLKSNATDSNGRGLFKIVIGGSIIVRSKMVSRQVKLFRRGLVLYAELKAGEYVRVAPDGRTSSDSTRWDEIFVPEKYDFLANVFSMELIETKED